MTSQFGKQCFSLLMLLNFLTSLSQICRQVNKPFNLLYYWLSWTEGRKSMCASYFYSSVTALFYSSKLSNLNIFWVNLSVLIMGHFFWLESPKKVRQLITQLLFYAVGRQSFITRYSQPLPGSRRNSKATELHAWQSSRWQPYKSDWQKRFKSMHFWQYLPLKRDPEPLKGGYFLTAFAFLSSGSGRTHKCALTHSGRGWHILSKLFPRYHVTASRSRCSVWNPSITNKVQSLPCWSCFDTCH